jgi:uncharacterized protein YcnI
MTKRYSLTMALAATVCFSSSMAFAHITLDVKQAPVGDTYRAVFRVPHGCSGKPTTRVRVQIPDGVIQAKPMPKAGWTLEMVKGAYAAPADYFGNKVTEGTREVSWRGSLDDDQYDEFVISLFITDQLKAGATLYFPVVQECGSDAERWIEIPKAGEKEPPHPAPGVKLLPKS